MRLRPSAARRLSSVPLTREWPQRVNHHALLSCMLQERRKIDLRLERELRVREEREWQRTQNEVRTALWPRCPPHLERSTLLHGPLSIIS